MCVCVCMYMRFPSSLPAPAVVSNLHCLTASLPNSLELVWSPPIGEPVLSYLVQIREYVFMNNQINTEFQSEKEFLSTRITVTGLGKYDFADISKDLHK